MNNYFIIKDQAGNYVSESSFMYISKNEVVWSTKTGMTNIFSYYGFKKRAEDVVEKLNTLLAKYGIHKDLTVQEISEKEIDKIPAGKYINTYYNIQKQGQKKVCVAA